jgi:cyclic pyranopterin phosphate synthase
VTVIPLVDPAHVGPTPHATSPLALRDRHGRVATDLRLSLTDKCNLRCVYCMPEEGLPWLTRNEVLTDDELVRLVRIATSMLGVTQVRLTGGEPLIRAGVVELVARLAALENAPSIAVTTNGLGLSRLARPLADAGLARVNVSLDTVDRVTFRELTRRDRLDDVLTGMAAAAEAGLSPVKVNAVLMRGINDGQAADLLAYCLANGYELRFIEQMPLDAQHGWQRSTMVTAAEIRASLSQRYDLRAEDAVSRGAAPAQRYLVDGGPATVGIIASVSEPFCGACDRTRLTADGQMRTCLFATAETDLRTPLRNGADDRAIAMQWSDAMLGKLPGHGIDDPTFLQPSRPMSAIGG